jgi:hypothetical protein
MNSADKDCNSDESDSPGDFVSKRPPSTSVYFDPVILQEGTKRARKQTTRMIVQVSSGKSQIISSSFAPSSATDDAHDQLDADCIDFVVNLIRKNPLADVAIPIVRTCTFLEGEGRRRHFQLSPFDEVDALKFQCSNSRGPLLVMPLLWTDHFVVLVLNFNLREIMLLDSMADSDGVLLTRAESGVSTFSRKLPRKLRDEYQQLIDQCGAIFNMQFVLLRGVPVLQQPDHISCGYFCILNLITIYLRFAAMPLSRVFDRIDTQQGIDVSLLRGTVAPILAHMTEQSSTYRWLEDARRVYALASQSNLTGSQPESAMISSMTVLPHHEPVTAPKAAVQEPAQVEAESSLPTSSNAETSDAIEQVFTPNNYVYVAVYSRRYFIIV